MVSTRSATPDGDLPAMIHPDGVQKWWQHGEQHRDGDKPAVISKTIQEWWQHGQRHRENGPAIVFRDGLQMWIQHDQKHRLDGPAVTNGGSSEEYWIDNVQYTKEEFYAKRALRQAIQGNHRQEDLATSLLAQRRHHQ